MRSVFFATLLVLLGALLAGLVPPQALAAPAAPVGFVSNADDTLGTPQTPGTQAPDALFAPAGGRPVSALRSARPGMARSALAGAPELCKPAQCNLPPRPASRQPSAVRDAHRVDGLSLPLLR